MSHGSKQRIPCIIRISYLGVHFGENKCALYTGKYGNQKLWFDEQAIVLVNIYAPNDANQQVAFFSKLNYLLQEFSHDNIIIGGDFNCALSPKDKLGGTPVTRKASVIKEIENLNESHNLRDIWRTLNPDLSRFTWRNKSL